MTFNQVKCVELIKKTCATAAYELFHADDIVIGSTINGTGIR